MFKIIEINSHNLGIYILSDEPTTCGICGARTDFEDITDNVQLHECLNLNCGNQFITEMDEGIKGDVEK